MIHGLCHSSLSVFCRYSSKHKYLQLEFSGDLQKGSEQIRMLEVGIQLGNFLNRTVILPKFVTNHTEHNLLFWGGHSWCFSLLDGRNLFREHMFLKNKLIPKSILTSSVTIYNISFSNNNIFNHIQDIVYPFSKLSVIILHFNKNILLTGKNYGMKRIKCLQNLIVSLLKREHFSDA